MNLPSALADFLTWIKEFKNNEALLCRWWEYLNSLNIELFSVKRSWIERVPGVKYTCHLWISDVHQLMTSRCRSQGLHFPARRHWQLTLHLASVGRMFPLSCLSPWNGATHSFRLGFSTTVFVFYNCPKISKKFFPANFYLGTIMVLDARRITYLQVFAKAVRFVVGSNWDDSGHYNADCGWVLYWRLIS